MLQEVGFIPQRQFHVLINLANKDHHLTVLPNHAGHFRVIEKGEVLAEVDCKPQSKCVCRKGRLRKPIINQLEKHIKNYYSQFKSLL